MSYDIGNIDVKIKTISEDTINKLDNLIDKISKIDTSLQKPIKALNQFSKIKFNNLKSNLDNISNLNFENFSKAFSPLSNINVTNLSSLSRILNSISKFNLDNIDFRNLYNQINTLSRTVEPFITKIREVEPSLKAFVNALDLGKVNAQMTVAEARVKAIEQAAASKKVIDEVKLEKANIGLDKAKLQLDKLNEKANKTDKIFGKVFNLSRLYFWMNYTKRIANGIANMFQNAIDYNEILNKFQVSMGAYSQKATKFANELANAFNMSTNSIMNYMSTFNNMLSALGGIEDYQSEAISETLTKMAIDYASLFNIGIETAMNQFQSVLSGSIRPIRSTSGYDVSETTIFALYQQLGGTKTMRQLTQLEKRMLRILALQKQMSDTGAAGDYNKTINESANILKQISETFKEFGKWVGMFGMQYLKPFIEMTLTSAIVMKNIAKSLAVMTGYKEATFEAGQAFDILKDNVDDTNDSIKELTGDLLSFDKFEVLDKTSSKEQTNDLDMIISALGDYTSILETNISNASVMADKILLWLGFTKNIDEETGNVNYTLDGTYTRIEKILNIVTSLANLFIANKIMHLITYIVKLKKEMDLLSIASKGLQQVGIFGIIYALTTLITQWKDLSTLQKVLYNGIIALSVAFLVLSKNMSVLKNIIPMIANLFKSLQNATMGQQAGMFSLMTTIVMAIAVFSKWGDMNSWQKIISVVGLATTAFFGLAVAVGAFKSAVSYGIAAAAIIAGITAITIAVSSAKKNISKFANGGFPDTGQLFIANEEGPELVGNIGGKTSVANNDMITNAIKQASYEGMRQALGEQKTSNQSTKIIFEGRNIENNAFARAIMPALKVEDKRVGGNL